MTLSACSDFSLSSAKPHNRRACVMPDLSHGRAVIKHPPRAPRWQYRERPLHPDVSDLPKSGVTHVRLWKGHLKTISEQSLSASGAQSGQAGQRVKT